jgi:hypothetical protein
VVVLLVFLAIGLSAGCAAKKQTWGDPRTGLLLTYRMPEDQSLRYESTIEQTHSMRGMGGQSRSFDADRLIEVSMTSDGVDEGNHQLTITIDHMEYLLESPRGEMGREVSEIEGKSFAMVLSSQGEELNLSGADAVVYDLGPAGRQSVEDMFVTFFPDLAPEPVRVGETWKTTSTTTDKAYSSGTTVNLESVNTFEGLETVDGVECVKITSVMTGSMEGASADPREIPAVAGTVEGTGVWFFAYKKGVLVKMNTRIRVTGEMTMGGQQGIPMPMTQETTVETRLLQ